MYNRILAPLDGSELSECGLKHVMAIARGCHVPEVILLSVIEPGSVPTQREDGAVVWKAQKDRQQEAEDYLARVAGELKKDAVVARTTLVTGKTADEILNCAKKEKVDLIIMSTHGRSGLSRWLIGSVTDRVVRGSPVPIIAASPAGCRIGPGEADEGKKAEGPTYDVILAPLDGSEFSECSLKHVVAIAGGCHVPDVVLLRVVEPVRAELYSEGNVELLRQAEEDGKVYAQQYLDETAEDLKKKGINARTVVQLGRPDEEILDYVRKNRTDLVIMSTHGRAGITRWALGSVADRVMRHASSPVMLVSPPGCRE